MPAFVGLGAPYWDPDARGAILGLTRGSGAAEIARATLDSIAYQVRDVVEAMDADLGLAAVASCGSTAGERATSCAASIADQLGRPVERPAVRETTAFGAAALAGLAVGFWADPAEIAAIRAVDRRFEPTADDAGRASGVGGVAARASSGREAGRPPTDGRRTGARCARSRRSRSSTIRPDRRK